MRIILSLIVLFSGCGLLPPRRTPTEADFDAARDIRYLPEEQAELEAAERKSIAELEELLEGAMKEAGVAT